MASTAASIVRTLGHLPPLRKGRAPVGTFARLCAWAPVRPLACSPALTRCLRGLGGGADRSGREVAAVDGSLGREGRGVNGTDSTEPGAL